MTDQVIVWLRQVDADTDNACWVVCARRDKGAVPFSPREQQRSTANHNHYFATLNNMWQNLPDDMRVDFPSPTHLRKWALIKCGYCTKVTLAAGTADQAKAIVRAMKKINDYAVAENVGDVVNIYVADSQSYKAMGSERFKASKQQTLDVIADLLGVRRKEAERSTATMAQ